MLTDAGKIMFITDVFGEPSGAERNVYVLVTELVKRGYEPIVCCLRGGELSRATEKRGIVVFDLDMRRLYDLDGIRKLAKLVGIVRKEGVRLVMTYHDSSDLLGWMIKLLTGVAVISNRRDMGYKLKKRHVVAYRLANRSFDRIVTVSQAVKDRIIEREGASAEKIPVIYNGLDLSLYNSDDGNADGRRLKTSLGIRDSEQVVGIIAALRRIKDHRSFILAASMVLKERPNVKFLLVGHDFQEKDFSHRNLEEYADHLGVKDRIAYIGPRDDIPEVLSILDVSVLTSLSEGFSNTILESMAAGKPVVATNVGGNPEAVVEGETGYLVPPKDAPALAARIVELLEQEELAKAMGKAGRERAASMFSLSRVVDEYEALFREVLER